MYQAFEEKSPQQPRRPPNLYRKQTENGEATCRICFEGREDGVLFKPCLCDGSMGYIHVQCLKTWMSTGRHGASTECPNCKYRYQFGRIETVAWMSYPCIIELFTTIVCLVLWCSLYATLAFFDSPKGDFYSTHLRNWGLAVAESRRVNLAICATILFSSFGYMMYLLSCMVCCSRVCGASAFNSIEFGTICCCSLGRYSRACWYRLVPCGAACVIFWGVTMAFTGTYAILKGMIKTGRDAIQEYVLDIRPEKYGLINEGSSASCCGCCCPPTHGMSENKHREP